MKRVALLIFLGAFAGCKGAASRVDGRYTGTSERGDETRAVVAFATGTYGDAAKFEVFDLSASGQGQSISIQLASKSAARVVVDGVTFAASVKDGCGQGRAAARDLSVCWSETELKLDVRDVGTQHRLLSFSLRRSDEVPGDGGSEHVYSLEEMLGRAKFLAYGSREEGVRAYQAHKRVVIARDQLLPHFNIKSVGMFLVMGPGAGLLDAIGGLVPFLFPSNWYKLNEARHLDTAERLTLASVRGNEMNLVHGMYLTLHRERREQELLDAYLERIREIRVSVERAQGLGALEPGSLNRFDLRVIRLTQDAEQQRLMVREQQAALSQAAALPPIEELKIADAIPMPDFGNLPSVDPRSFVAAARAASLEARALTELIAAARSKTRQTTWSFLDPSAGADLGFALPQEIKVATGEVEALQTRQEGLLKTIEEHAVEVAAEMNYARNAFELGDRGFFLARTELERTLLRLATGSTNLLGPGFIKELTDQIEDVFSFETDRLNAAHARLVAESRLHRLLLTGEYATLEAGLDLR